VAGVAAGHLRAPRSFEESRGRAVEVKRGSDEPESHRRRGIAQNELTCGGGSAAKSGADEDRERG